MFRIGLLVPSSNTTMELEFWRVLPKDFSIHTARLKLRDVTVEGLELMESEIDDEALKLADADVDVILYGCTTGSLFRGVGHDKLIESRIERLTGKPAISTSGAVVSALRFLKAEKISVITPYIDELNILEERFLVGNGFKVMDLKSLNMIRNVDIGRVSSDAIMNLFSKLDYSSSDAIFISCTNMPTLNLIDKLEGVAGIPVLSSNSASMWAVLKRLNYGFGIKGYGRLLASIGN
ncbi:MAG: aspartate/glutamate racemase family protein [archaeon YNP-LCB-003-016]|uniref:maleate cis-trans isomerase family protein n=1 Tax=Candidatus Culexarchaeum yellowstonense TaxID=2928963 RepID=UPI0026EA6B52|nr:aspartate/glutamate racemase family protein [Candidatus Culexarchaeum yellowstonense]MCR6691234.1 aspartate/glutamate racemase family protein [Candidatus Culexarchaeum yellowstonense]